MKVWLVLPVYNEAPNLSGLLAGCEQLASRVPLKIVVVDDGSTDDSMAVAKGFQQRLDLLILPNGQNRGLGFTFMRGLTHAVQSAADDDVIVVMDGDNSHLPEQIPTLLVSVTDGADVVIASRYQPGAKIAGVSGWRQFLSTGMRWLFELAYPIAGVRDYSCGFRAYRASTIKRALEQWGERLFYQEGFACMVGILIKLHKSGARFSEIPLILRYDQKMGPSKMRVGRTVWATLKILLKERFS